MQKKPMDGTGTNDEIARESQCGSPYKPAPRPLQVKIIAPNGVVDALPSKLAWRHKQSSVAVARADSQSGVSETDNECA